MLKLLAIITLFSFLGHTGCSSKNIQKLTPGEIDLKTAKEFQEAGRYELAIEHYSNIKNKYPLSPEAVEAELELAETYYLQASYIEARASFEAFIDLHPQHSKVDFAAYRIAMTYYKQIPKTIDRDMAPAGEAITEFGRFVKKYPHSSYVPEAKTNIEEARKELAEKEMYVAEFYFIRNHFQSAAGRYRNILKEYRGVGYEEKALFRLGVCYYNLKSTEQARSTLKLFLERYKNSSESGRAQKMLDSL